MEGCFYCAYLAKLKENAMRIQSMFRNINRLGSFLLFLYKTYIRLGISSLAIPILSIFKKRIPPPLFDILFLLCLGLSVVMFMRSFKLIKEEWEIFNRPTR